MTVEQSIDLLSSVLATHGIALRGSALGDALGDDLEIARIEALCARQGLETKVVRIGPTDLPFLPPGALIGLKGGLALVVESGPKVVLGLPGGKRASSAEAERLPLSGFALELSKRSNAPRRLFGLLRWRLGSDARFLRAIVLLVIVSVLMSGLGLLGPILSRIAMNKALPEGAVSLLEVLAIATITVGVHTAWTQYLRRRVTAYLGARLAEVSSGEVFASLVRLPYAELRKHPVGRISQALSSSSTYATALPEMLTPVLDAVVALGYLVFLFTIDAHTAAIVGAFGLLSIPVGVLFGALGAKTNERVLGASRRQSQTLLELLTGIETAKIEASESALLKRWLENLTAEQEARVLANRQGSVFALTDGLLGRAAWLFAMSFAAYRALEGALTPGDMVAALQASSAFMGAFRPLAHVPSSWLTLKTHQKNVDDLLDVPSEEADDLSTVEGDATLAVEGVWFRYADDAPWLFRGTSFRIENGSHVLLRWPSGAGKTTLLRLLAGLLPPEKGSILVGGVNATRARTRICYLPQSAPLFTLSVLENLTILSGGASRERIIEAARATGLMSIVEKWPMQLETLVAPGARNISTGQRQLILLTAAVASTRPVLLLDEPFAHMDGHLRAHFASANLLKGKTVVSVIHDATPQELVGAGGERLIELARAVADGSRAA